MKQPFHFASDIVQRQNWVTPPSNVDSVFLHNRLQEPLTVNRDDFEVSPSECCSERIFYFIDTCDYGTTILHG